MHTSCALSPSSFSVETFSLHQYPKDKLGIMGFFYLFFSIYPPFAFPFNWHTGPLGCSSTLELSHNRDFVLEVWVGHLKSQHRPPRGQNDPEAALQSQAGYHLAILLIAIADIVPPSRGSLSRGSLSMPDSILSLALSCPLRSIPFCLTSSVAQRKFRNISWQV